MFDHSTCRNATSKRLGSSVDVRIRGDGTNLELSVSISGFLGRCFATEEKGVGKKHPGDPEIKRISLGTSKDGKVDM